MDHLKFELDNLPKQTISEPPSPASERKWTMSRVELLMSSYRKADFINPDGFIATLTAILCQYEPEIVEYVTAPETGIQRRCKWPPAPAEIVEACAAEIAHRTKVMQNSSLQVVPRLPRPRFNVAESYEEMTKKHGRPFGPFELGRQLLYEG